MTGPDPKPDVAALLSAADRAQAEYLRAADDERVAALNAAFRPAQPLRELPGEPADDLPTTSPAALVVALQRLGARPLVNPAADLDTLAHLLNLPGAVVTDRLRHLAADDHLAGRFARMNLRGDAQTVAVLAGLLLARH